MDGWWDGGMNTWGRKKRLSGVYQDEAPEVEKTWKRKQIRCVYGMHSNKRRWKLCCLVSVGNRNSLENKPPVGFVSAKPKQATAYNLITERVHTAHPQPP